MINFQVEKIDNGYLLRTYVGYDAAEEMGVPFQEDRCTYGMDLATTLDMINEQVDEMLDALNDQDPDADWFPQVALP